MGSSRPMKQLLGTITSTLLLAPCLLAQGTTPPAPVPAPSAAAPAAPAASAVEQGGLAFREMFDKGGPTLYVLVGLSIIMFALIGYYILTIRRGTVVSDSFMKTADALIRKQDYLGLLAVCNRRNECIAQITQKTLDFATKNPTATFDEVREVTEAEGQRQASALVQRITYMADIGKVAPLIGLLGTVFGIIKQFAQISQEKMLAAQLKFAGGVSEALLNTAAGLFIAIPSVVVFSIYRGRVSALISEMEAATTHIMALLAAQYKRVTAAAAAAAATRAATPVKAAGRTRGDL
jgi:biopolymer transport protein ExbB